MSSARRFRHLTRRRRKHGITRGFSFSRPATATEVDVPSSAEESAITAPTTRMVTGKVKHKQARKPYVKVATPNQRAEQPGRPQWAPGIGDPAHWTVEPSSDTVNGAKLLDAIAATFDKYVVLPAHSIIALALWVIHTYVIDAGDISPILAVTSPTKRCGKTTLLKILAWIAFRTVFVSNISASSIFRYVDAKQPTLLIDEGDTFLTANDQMRGTLNAGHARGGAYIMRTRGNNVIRFSTWGPKAIALIGTLPATLADRSITISMQRKKSSESRARYRDRDCQDFHTLRSRALRWADDNFKALVASDPNIPKVLNDRAADNWRPLIAIADLAGGKWPDAARRSAVALSVTIEDDSTEIRLLSDLQWLFEGKPEVHDGKLQRAYPLTDKLFSQTIVDELNKMETSPWGAWRRGTGFTKRDLAKALKGYGAVPETVRIGSTTAKGYYKAKLADAFARYLPPSANVTASQTNKSGQKPQELSVTQTAGVTDEKVQKTAPNRHRDAVTLPAGGTRDHRSLGKHPGGPADAQEALTVRASSEPRRHRIRVRAR